MTIAATAHVAPVRPQTSIQVQAWMDGESAGTIEYLADAIATALVSRVQYISVGPEELDLNTPKSYGFIRIQYATANAPEKGGE